MSNLATKMQCAGSAPHATNRCIFKYGHKLCITVGDEATSAVRLLSGLCFHAP